MKKMTLIVLFIVLSFVSSVYGDEIDNQLPNQATAQVRTSTRQMIQAGIDKDETIRMTRLMVQNQFTEQEVLRAHKMIMNANGKGLSVGPIMNKAFEGMTKQIQARNIIQAMETVQNRYILAQNYANRITEEKTSREQIRNALAQGLAAGLKERDAQAISEALQQRTRTETRTRTNMGPLGAATFMAARDMARLGVSSEATREVISQAIQHRYTERNMQMLSKSFADQSRQVSPNILAANYMNAIRSGISAESLGNYGIEGGSAGQGGFGHGSGNSGGAGSGGAGGGGDGGHR